MARYNTVNPIGTVTGTTTITAPGSGEVTTFTGSAPYTVTLPSPVLYLGLTQTLYNSTSGSITLSTPSGNFIGPTVSGSTMVMPTGSVAVLASNGTNYILADFFGGALSAGGTVTLSPVGTTVTISPSGSGANLTMSPAGTGALTPAGALTLGTAGQTETHRGNIVATTSNQTVTLSPAGTGTVTISPAGALTINPTTASTINNTSIGATTASTGRFTTIVGTTNTAGSSSGGALDLAGGARLGAKLYVGGDIENTGIVTSSSTSHFKLPVGTNAQRPSAAAGQLRYNSEIAALETHNGTFWKDLTRHFTQTDVGSNISGVIWNCYWVDTSAAARTITLPNSGLTKGDTIRFIDLRKTFDSNALSIARNGNLIQGDAADMTVNVEGASFDLVWHSATYGWFIFSI
jgi:hypothetical protein